MIRTDRLSLGLPLAYMVLLLLIHVPGAIAHLLPAPFLTDDLYTEIGSSLAALGAVCFVAGVWLARASYHPGAAPVAESGFPERRKFWLFCLFGGWTVV